MSCTYLHYMFCYLIAWRNTFETINQNDWDDGYQRASNTVRLTVIILYKYKRKRWFVGMAINCGIANQLPVIAICSDRLLVRYALITIDKLLTRFKMQKFIMANYFFIYCDDCHTKKWYL